MAADEEGNGEVDLRFKSLLTVSQRRLGLSLSDDEKSKLEKYCFFGIKTEMTVTFSEIFKFRPVESRMSAFIDRFSMTKSISKKSTKSMRKPGLDLDWELEILMMKGACLAISFPAFSVNPICLAVLQKHNWRHKRRILLGLHRFCTRSS